MRPDIILILSALIFCSCNREKDLLEQALALAGNNRVEMESVINHYNDNPQKQEAAKWIISNMPGNSNPWSRNIQTYIDSIRMRVLPKDEGNRLWDSIGQEGLDCINRKDITTVSASFLIEDIDKAFSTWQESPWHQEIDFDRFKKFILPYRVCNEQLHNGWRDSLYETYFPLVKDTRHAKEAFEKIRRVVKKSYGNWAYKFEYALDPVTMQKYVSSRCIDRCIYLASVCRAVGLPVVIDKVGLWTNYSNSSHSWVSLVLEDGTYTIVDDDSIAKKLHIVDAATFSLHDNMPNDYPYDAMMMKRYAKIWRTSFHNTFRNRDSVFYKGETVNNYNPKITDVSAFYGLNNDVTIRSEGVMETVSLNVYSITQGWTPIVTRMCNGQETIFSNLADSILLLPVGQGESGKLILGNPFYISDGDKIEIKLDTTYAVSGVLRRKYPMIARWFNRYLRYRGASFIGSRYADFHQNDTLCQITNIPTSHNSIAVNYDQSYRYIRKESGHLGSSKMEKINILDKKGNLLYSGIDETIDLGHDHQIGSIDFIPWNDGNFIIPGHEYELVYWDGCKWTSLGHKIANSHELVYNNIPASSLLLLHDRTEGKEERPFILSENTQIWW